ncbi:TOBE domain-containing protein (plasmid) [Sinorhizobium medicae]|uniref:TOBE domain-containing protein n=1 Tax=Sinorhizobium medicae TaxID=110321 RepID=UPI002AF6BF91|nr:TOBE domain-containing protein [Sinorhizobium medicae]WQO50260.1 TOBE domain-containing protein [Sinorhizobium medicae]WQO96651.1 TOBE domain-containing protein [Sinorhizobium medicae]
MTLADGSAGGDRFRARVRVGAVELVGAESYVHGTLTNGEPLVFRVAGRSRTAIDEELEVAAEPESLHWFDAAGRRL